jgi:glycosyltransferase involved in cell wall biosynthesis
MSDTCPKVAILLNNVIGGGGVERVVVNLIKGLVKYPLSIDLLLFNKHSEFLQEVPPEVRIIEFPNMESSRIRWVFPLVSYLRHEKPSILVSHILQFNVIAVLAKFLSGISLHTILVEHLSFDCLENKTIDKSNKRFDIVDFLRLLLYPRSNLVAAVSQGLASELESHLKMRAGATKVLYNPVIDRSLILKTQSICDHPWLQPNQPPFFLAVGRLEPQKDFSTLINAFAIFRQKHVARLIILGEGTERQKLEAQIVRCRLEEDISLPGFSDNPYVYMGRASAFVLSSIFEALPTVVIEALACGCQIVATDCPYGPDEILMSGKYGLLVPVGDIKSLANAMEKIIDSPISPNLLRQRASDFTVENATLEYLKVMELDCLL